MRYPTPLQPGDTIGVTAPSSGVAGPLRPRLDAAVASLRERGFEVVLGDCLDGSSVTSAPRARRAAELGAMLTDPAIRAVVPPWGGELAVDLLEELDWAAVERAEPTWVVGWSDLDTVLLPLTTRLGWATLHGWNLMDTPYAAPDGLLHWVDVASATGPLTQTSPGRYRADGWDDYVAEPGVDRMTLPDEGGWSLLGGGEASFSGRLVGGCLEVLSPLAGTAYADVRGFGEAHADDGLVVYVEAAEHGAYDVARALHGLRLAGWFDHATGILVGRTSAPAAEHLTQAEAVKDALGMLDLPVVLDVEIGHVQPFLPLVNGALADVDTGDRTLVQTFA
ncbi:S66 peptidase family protein [Nocardioides sp. Leaf307]|uniref:S66 family peptidase n=1 Tax=Nocardioides sp. Leaf307 TaxID=1736331 RepID=UPI000702CDD3|nr:S66 peptidase family protein [Nocardioides sp. Leaf307]KQQ41744.1 peptidase S66 family protein [Nocardioides sp. Leaf307]